MAGTTITRTPNRYTEDGLRWWTSDAYEVRLGLDDNYFAGYALEPGTQADFTAASIEVDFSQTELWTDSATFQCSLYNSQDLDNSHLIGSQSFALTNYEGTPVRHKFNFPNVSASGTGLYFKIVYTSGGGYWYVTHPTASATYTVPALGVGVTPSSVAVGNSVTLSFSNRFTQTLSVVLKYGSTQLTSFSVSADSKTVNTSNDWFTTAGVTGNSMRVDVSVSDGTGRTATTNFTVTRSGLSVGVSPSSVNLGNSVTLSFSGRYGNSVTVQFKYGTQLLESKTATSDSLSITPPLSWFTTAGTTGSMRVDVLATDSTGRTASANFTLVMPALTVSASPSSLYTGSYVTIALGYRLEQSVTIILRYQQTELYRTTINAYTVSIQAQESWFTTASVSGNTMQVTATVSDGLGRTASTTFTVNKPTASTATPTEPVSVTKDGEDQITFKWAYSGNGTQTKAQLQWKTASGDWQSLGTVNGAGTSYTAAAYKFPQGAISWRVRVTNSFGLVGSWSTASFNVSYAALSVSASPSSVYVDNPVTLSFTNRLSRALSIVIKYNDITLTTLSASSDSVQITPTSDWFSTASVAASSMQVTVSVSDNLGRSATARFTVRKPQASTATPTEPVSVSKNGAAAIAFKWNYAGDGTQTKAQLQWKTSSGDWQSLGTVNSSATSYSAAAYKFPVGSVNWRVRVTNSFGLTGGWSSASFNVSYAALSVSASPSSVYVDNPVTLSFTNRLSRTMTLAVTYGDTPLIDPLTVAADSATITPTAAWFSTAGVTDDTMQVTASISDALGRTATDRFTAKKPQASTATPTEPVSVSKNGAAAIAFKWTYAGDGTQTKAELQWKTSSGDWQALGTVNGAGTSYSAAAYTFPLGSIQWRVRVTNSFGIVGNWSGSASFSVSYAALSVSASPSSIYLNNQGTLTFTNRLGRTLLLEFRANGQVLQPAWEVVADSVPFKPTAAWFETAEVTGSSMQVTAAVSDALGRTASTTFTAVNPQGSTATPTAPKSTTVDGAGAINFAWNVSSDWGQQIKAELQWSTDGVVWTDLTTVTGSDQTWTAPAVEFPAGTIYWRARVTNVWGILGEWSSPVSFTISYAAVSQVVQVNSQTSGIFARGMAKNFSARFEASGPVYSPFTFQSATFKWRAGTSGDWTEVTMTSSDNGVTAAATIQGNTFPQGVMQWMIEGTDNTGRTTETPVYTLTAATSAVDVSPIRPVNTVETNNSEIGFELAFVSLDGSLPQAAEWRWSSDGTEWHSETLTALDIRDGVLAFTIPAGTFPAGTIRWQARAENSADTWGEWSSVVSFKALGAPVVAAVTGDGRPFLSISWQTLSQGEYGQQAYKIEVDGKLYGPFFGADVRSYTLKEPLEDGTHWIKVAAQNRFGLWSDWTASNVVVKNVRGVLFNVFAQASGTYPIALVIMSPPPMAPIITRQPQDYRTTHNNALFSVSYKTSGDLPVPGAYGCTVSWEYRTGTGAAWQPYTGQTLANTVFVPVTQEMDGYQYRAKLSNRAGEIYSNPATYYYGEPAGYASELQEGEWKAPTGYFLIYRNGTLIAKTYNNYFSDNAVIDKASYEVLQVLPDGYYTRGTVAAGYETVTIKVDAPTLITLDGKKALTLTLSEDARRAQNIQRAREVAYTQYEGAAFPEAEIGEHETLSISGDCAWTWDQKADADAFEALLGTPVIYKTPGGEMVVGVLDGFTQKDAHFYRTARFTIQQMDWRDFRDEP